MTDGTRESDWQSLLNEMNRLVFNCELSEEVPEDVLKRGWLGEPPASEEDIAGAELRLGLDLPPSYKAFLRAANGWHWPHPEVRMILPVERIERIADSNNPDVAAWRAACKQLQVVLAIQKGLAPGERVEAEVLDFIAKIEIGLPRKPGVEGLIFLDPISVSVSGEMQTASFPNWKAHRGPFWQFMLNARETLAKLANE